MRTHPIEYSDSAEWFLQSIQCTAPAIQECNIQAIHSFRKGTSELEKNRVILIAIEV